MNFAIKIKTYGANCIQSNPRNKQDSNKLQPVSTTEAFYKKSIYT